MALSTVTESDLLAEIAKATRKAVGGAGLLVGEICEVTGRSERTVRLAISKGLKNGTVKRAIKTIERIDGRLVNTTSYVFLKGKK